MIQLIVILLFVFFGWGLFCYGLGHSKAWTLWEDAIKGEKLSKEARDKIAGLQ